MSSLDKPQGASLFLIYKDKVLFGVKKITYSEEKIISLTGIGGKVEKGETYRQCVLREAYEEIACVPRIIDFAQTIILTESQKQVENHYPERPWAVVNRPLPGSVDDLQIYVFGAVLDTEPKPVENIRHLLLFPPEQLYPTLKTRPTLRSLLEQGVEMISNHPKECPSDGKVTFIDSPEIYIDRLGPEISQVALQIISRGKLKTF